MENNKNIYIDLDSILDTRFSILYNIDKDMLHKIYSSKEYDNRLVNEFDYIPSNIFNTLFKYRNNDILKISYFTKILKILMIEIGILKNNLQLLNLNQNINIDLNIYPYAMEDNINNIKDKIIDMLNLDGVDVNIININTKNITPSKIDNEYATLIMYDGMEWFKHMLNTESFKNYGIPTVNLIIPALMHSPVIMRKIEDYESMFNDIIKQSAMFINIKFTPVEYFNILM